MAGFDPVRVRAVTRESYALTLWTFLQLRDSERISGMRARMDRLDVASLSAVAFHEPSKLQRIEGDLREEIRGAPRTNVTLRDSKQAAADMIERIRRGGVLDDVKPRT